MPLVRVRYLLWLLLIDLSLRAQDFRNFTYPIPAGAAEDAIDDPDRLTWMSNETKSTVTLVNGRFDFEKKAPEQGPSAILDSVRYGYLTSSGQLDAMVSVGYHTGGTANWNYVYAFDLSHAPKLLGWFQTGDRGSGGLYDLWVSSGQFIVELLDPGRLQGDCCSDGIMRSTYEWKKAHFVRLGPVEYGDVPRLRHANVRSSGKPAR